MIFDVKSWCSPETKLLPALVTRVILSFFEARRGSSFWVREGVVAAARTLLGGGGLGPLPEIFQNFNRFPAI